MGKYVEQHVRQRDLPVGEVAARSGLRVSAVHFYEARGLIHAMRSLGNQRRFTREVLRRIAVIKVAQRAGIPLARIWRLTRLRDQLSGCIGCGCLSIDVCPLRNPGDELAAEGPGPRLLDPAP